MIIDDLEILTGQLVRGDLTPIVYELIKDSPFLNLMIKETTSVHTEKHSAVSVPECGGGLSFEGWFTSAVQPYALSRNAKHVTKYGTTASKR